MKISEYIIYCIVSTAIYVLITDPIFPSHVDHGNAQRLTSPTEEFIQNIEDKFFNESLENFENGKVTRFKIKNNDCSNLTLISDNSQVEITELNRIVSLWHSKTYELFIKNSFYTTINKPYDEHFYTYGENALKYEGSNKYILFNSKLAEKIEAIYERNQFYCYDQTLENKLSLNEEEKEIISNLK